MSHHVTKLSRDADAASDSSKQRTGMSDWMRRIAKPPVPTSKSSVVLFKGQGEQMKEKLVSEADSDSCSLTLSLSRDWENNLKVMNRTKDKKHLIYNMCEEEEEFVDVGSSSRPLDCNHAESSGQVFAFQKQFSSDNFAGVDGDSHDLEQCDGYHMEHNPSMAKNFFPFFHRKRSMCRGILSTDKLLPCSVHNVETMRIRTMVESLETRSRKISVRARQFHLTKEKCVNFLEDHQTSEEPMLTKVVKEKIVGESAKSSPLVHASRSQGARIEHLAIGAELTGNSLISKTDSRNESSVQHGIMQIDDGRNRLVPLGIKDKASSPLRKDHSMDKTIGASTEKPRSKRPITEIPDMNEEIPTLQPERSSTDSKEVSISTVNSLNAEHLSPVGEYPAKPDFSPEQDPPDANSDQNSRWIKRLRVNSSDEYCVGTKNSDIEEPSSHKKYGKFLNKIAKTSVNDTDQNTDSPKNSISTPNCPIDGVKNSEHSCPWVQRWWKDTNFASNPSLKKIDPHVFCEPDSLQLSVYELGKRQFPSIGAMALMGKTMNGFRSCEIKKKGSVFVWNTKEY